MRDLSSLNGTFLNAKRLRRNDEVELLDGSTLVVGQTTLVFSLKPDANASFSSPSSSFTKKRVRLQSPRVTRASSRYERGEEDPEDEPQDADSYVRTVRKPRRRSLSPVPMARRMESDHDEDKEIDEDVDYGGYYSSDDVDSFSSSSLERVEEKRSASDSIGALTTCTTAAMALMILATHFSAPSSPKLPKSLVFDASVLSCDDGSRPSTNARLVFRYTFETTGRDYFVPCVGNATVSTRTPFDVSWNRQPEWAFFVSEHDDGRRNAIFRCVSSPPCVLESVEPP